MKVLVIVKATDESEAGQMPKEEMLATMGKYNETLVKAGIMLDANGLHPSVRGARVKFEGDSTTVVDGPFAETKELVSGYWVWEVKSLDEAVEWLKRAPFADGEEVELRPIFEPEDFGDEYTPELRERDAKLAEQIAARS